ncbi:hypothetical protein ABIF65_011851 [Bradyrhizobium japonicum]
MRPFAKHRRNAFALWLSGLISFTRRYLLALVGPCARRVAGPLKAAVGARHAAGVDPLGVGRGVTKGAIEVRCDACGCAGYLPAWESEPGRRTYPGRCVKCGRQGPYAGQVRVR